MIPELTITVEDAEARGYPGCVLVFGELRWRKSVLVGTASLYNPQAAIQSAKRKIKACADAEFPQMKWISLADRTPLHTDCAAENCDCILVTQIINGRASDCQVFRIDNIPPSFTHWSPLPTL